MLTAVVVAGRVGAAIAAELGSMVVTEQIEALRSMGLEPARFLVVPRLLALLVMLPLLTIFADVVSILGGMLDRARPTRIFPIDSFIASVRQSIGFSRRPQGPAQNVRLRGHHRDGRRVSGAVDARRRGRRRQVRRPVSVVLAIILIFISNFVLSFLLFGRNERRERASVLARIDDVSLAFGDRIVLKNCSLDIVEGAITCIIGLSGAGKSTILRLLDGLIAPDTGTSTCAVNDICHMTEEKLNQLRQKIGFSFQFAALLDSLTVGENVALPLASTRSSSRAEIRRTVMDALESVGLRHAYDDLPAELSGGMLKRAGFARAIVTRPELVLYDEPTTGLDPIVTQLITDTIVKLRAKARAERRSSSRTTFHRSSRWPTTSRCSSKVRSSPTTPPSASATPRTRSSSSFCRVPKSARSRSSEALTEKR